MTKPTEQNLKSKLIKKTAKIRTKNAAATALASLASGPQINDLQPTLTIVERKLTDLKLPDKHVRTADTAHVASLVRSIRKFGFRIPILTRNGVVIDGVTRYLAMQQLGEPTISAIEVGNLSDRDCRLLAITLNRTAETGEWDLDALRIELVDLKVSGLDLSVSNFSLPELDIIMLDPEPLKSDALDKVPAVADGQPVSQLGDLWAMDEHRLLCGSAREAVSYQLLLGGEQVQCVFTDPPYNCVVKGNVSGLGSVVHDEFVEASGEMTKAEFADFLEDFLTHCHGHCAAGSVVFAFMDWRQYPLLVAAAEAAGLTNINTCVWDKGSGGMGGLYRSAHELVGVFCKGATPTTNNVKLGAHGRDRINIWRYPGANKPGSSAAKMLSSHPTPKNLSLVADALLDVTLPGDRVLDPFMGSGTTIIACAETGRVAFGTELDPKYVDVALRRWFNVTGQEAILTATGETFTQVAASRAAQG